METSTLLGIGLLGVAGFMVLGGANGEGSGGGGGGFGEAIEEAVETPGLTVNVPDYSDLIKSMTAPMQIITEQIPDVPTKKDSVSSSPFTGPYTGLNLEEAMTAATPYNIGKKHYSPIPGSPYTLITDAVEPKKSFLGGIFGGPYQFLPKTGEKSFWSSKTKTEPIKKIQTGSTLPAFKLRTDIGAGAIF